MTSSSTQVLSIKRKVLAAAATLMLVAGVSAAAAGAASAATEACGAPCISVFSSELGTYEHPNFVEAVLGGGGANVEQPVGLKRASGTDPSEDILPGGAKGGGTVSDFYADGVVSAAANRHYGHLDAVQQKYAPFKIETGLCVGLARVAYQNEGLTLQPCDHPTTVWVIYPAPADTTGGTSRSSTPRPPTSDARSRCTCRATRSRAVSRCRCRSAACSTAPARRRWRRGSSGALS